MLCPSALRKHTSDILNGPNLYDHQRKAAQRIHEGLSGDVRAVVAAAEMQAGKSGVALALACLQRLSMDDQTICDPAKRYDTLYMITMVDTSLLDQAISDFADAPNVVVSNFNRFRHHLDNEFLGRPPSLIIIDESHYGSGVASVRYCDVFDYLEKENSDCKIVFISATPFGALYAAECEYEEVVHLQESMESLREITKDECELSDLSQAATEAEKNSILRRDLKAKLVFQETSDNYYGVRQMLENNRITGLDEDNRNFLVNSCERENFIRTLTSHRGSGWALIRVSPGSAMAVKELLDEKGIIRENIHIIGAQLEGVPQDEHVNIDVFKRKYAETEMFAQVHVAITVASCRAGINFGIKMKETLLGTWDSTYSSVAAVVQANVGRACGYHNNRDPIHYTNINSLHAYGMILDYLEGDDGHTDAADFDGLREVFRTVCQEYNVDGLDVGLTVKNRKRKAIGDVQTYWTDSYLVVPAKLRDQSFDFREYTEDRELLNAIDLIREEYFRDYGPKVKGSRAMRGPKKRWVKAHWVNGDSYDNKEKAGKHGTLKESTISFTKKLNKGEAVEYNNIVAAGAAEYTEQKTISATVFSIYNMSLRGKASKKVMTEYDVHEMCQHFGVPPDDTMIVLYKRGEHDADATRRKILHNAGPEKVFGIGVSTVFGVRRAS